jgi:mannose-6-phosphate isomerase-like protein (cupin superfamily)
MAQGCYVTTVFDELLSGFRRLLDRVDHKQVRGFVAGIDRTMPARALAANSLPCLAHFDRAARIAGTDAKPFVRFLCERCHDFRWGQTYTVADFGQKFIDNYGWLEVFGTRGHFESRKMAGGFLVLGPGIDYPDHHHVAEEIYIPLTGGTQWRMGEGALRMREAGEVVHHASNVSHAMRTGDEPLLALYLWRGGPLAARSTVTGTSRQGSR